KQKTQRVKHNVKKKGINFVTEAMAQGVEETKDVVKVKYDVNGKEETIKADYVLVNVGRRPNTEEIGLKQLDIELDDRGRIKIDKQCRTNADNIYAIGDIVEGLPLAHKASYEGKIAAEAIKIGRANV